MYRNLQGRKRARRLARIYRARWEDSYPDWDELVRGIRHTRVPCSCTMCGNPRRHFGERTVQERRADEAMKAQLAELEI